jgi:hypothetical protein
MIGWIRFRVWLVAVVLGATSMVGAAEPAPAPAKSAPSATPTAAAMPPAVGMSVVLEHPETPAYVGEPLGLAVTLKNTSGKPLMILDWEHFGDELITGINYSSFPGAPDKLPNLGMASWAFNMTPVSTDYRELPPGETLIHRSLIPMLPGKALVGVRWHSPCNQWVSGTTGKIQTWDNGYTASAANFLPLMDISADPSPAMKKRFEDVQRKLEDPLVPAEQKGRMLAIMGDEQHYFAARFLREFAEKQPAGPMRDAAVWQLLRLAKVGTAYEAIPMLITRMADTVTVQDTRVAILDWATESLAGGATINIAGQAVYEWPEDLKKQARDAIQKMAADPNPYLASRAKDAVRKLEAAAPAK